jgi:transposase-like protein
MTTDVKKRRRSVKKELKVQAVIADVAKGSSITEVANKYGLCRQYVHTILSSKEAEAILKRGEDALIRLVDKSVETLQFAIDKKDVDLTNALKSAFAVLKTYGVVKEKSEIEVSVPKPTIITKRDGTQVILGTEKDEDPNE